MRPVRGRALLVLGLAIASVACQVKPPVRPEAVEGVVHVRVGTHLVSLASQDGKPLANVSVLVGGRLYPANGGALDLPDGVLSAAGPNGKVVVLAPGYAPLELPTSGSDGQLSLVPLVKGTTMVVGARAVSSISTTLAAAGNVAFVSLPPGFVTRAGTVVTLSSYTPTDGPTSAAAVTSQRTSLLAKAPGTGTACNQPLPCQIASKGLGLELAVDGPIQGTKLTVSYDLAALAKGTPDQQAAAAQLQKVFAAIIAAGDTALLQQLKDQYGISLDGDTLTFDVSLASVQQDGVTLVHVDGFDALGLDLEVTVVSSLSGELPAQAQSSGQLTTTAAAALPGGGIADPLGVPSAGALGAGSSLVSNNSGGSLVSNNSGGSLVSNNSGGSLVSNNSGGLVSNNGGGNVISNNGSAMTGTARTPFQPELAKFGLLSYQDWPLANATVSVVDHADRQVGSTTTADAHGAFSMSLPGIPIAQFFVLATGNSVRLRALASTPAANTAVTVPMNAATTAVTDLLLDTVALGTIVPTDVRSEGYAADVNEMTQLLDQPTAQLVVTSTPSRGAAIVTAQFAAAGYVLQSIPATATAAGGAVPTAAAAACPAVYSPLGATQSTPTPGTTTGPGQGLTKGLVPGTATPTPTTTGAISLWSMTSPVCAALAPTPTPTPLTPVSGGTVPTPTPAATFGAGGPAIATLSTTNLTKGGSLTITGSGFGATAGSIVVSSQQASGTCVADSWSDTQIVVGNAAIKTANGNLAGSATLSVQTSTGLVSAASQTVTIH